jgi:hypothetical protein
VVRKIALGIGGILLLDVASAKAATTGTLALRGIVTTQALVRLAAPTTAMALNFVSSVSSGNVATVRLSALANSVGGFTVSLGTSSTNGARGAATLLAEDGTAVPYQVSFGGKSVDLSRGETQLASITRETPDEGSDLQIATPSSVAKDGKRFVDRLILTIKAR